MNPRSPGAFLLSATCHALVVGMIVMLNLESCQQKQPPERILELVAGEGDNYGATEAPALGTEGGIKVDVPSTPTRVKLAEPDPEPPAPQAKPPEPEPAQPEPSQPEPPPIKPAPTKEVPPTPVPAPTAKTPEKKQPTIAQKLRRNLWAAEAKGKQQAAKIKAEEEKKMKKEEFDRLQAQKKVASASGKGSSTKVSHIDAEGIAKGVVGGSSSNKDGGAGGKALKRDSSADVDAYYALFKQKVLAAVDKPAGVSDNLSVTVEVFVSATGRLSNARVIDSSGSDEFDHAVLAAFNRVSMPEHPEHKGEPVQLTFRTKDVGQ